jgi:anti-anti-sigma regulatory factor
VVQRRKTKTTRSRPRAKAAPAAAVPAVPPPAAAAVVAEAAPAAAPAARVTLPASLLIRDAAALRGELSAALAAGICDIEASAVTSVDTAGLQLLVAALRSAAVRGMQARLSAPSEALCAGARQLGVDVALGLGGGS